MGATRWTSGGAFVLGTSTVGNDQVKASSGDEIDADKLEHLHKAGTNFELAIGATPVVGEYIVGVVEGTGGILRGFHCLLNDTGTSTDIDFDVNVNGTTALTGVVNIVHGTGDRVVVDGTLSTTTLAVGDVISIEIATVTSSTGAQGPFAWVEWTELAG